MDNGTECEIHIGFKDKTWDFKNFTPRNNSALHGLQPLLTAHKTNHLFHAFLHAIVLSLKALCDLSSTDIFV